MSLWRILVLSVLAAALLAGVILSWGSAGSALCAFCLISMAAALLVKTFLIDRSNDEFDTQC